VQIIVFKKWIEYIELECTRMEELEHATKSMGELECVIKRTKEL
jgi:hypothetical protein